MKAENTASFDIQCFVTFTWISNKEKEILSRLTKIRIHMSAIMAPNVSDKKEMRIEFRKKNYEKFNSH